MNLLAILDIWILIGGEPSNISWTYIHGQEKNYREEYNGRKGSHARQVIFNALKRQLVLWITIATGDFVSGIKQHVRLVQITIEQEKNKNKRENKKRRFSKMWPSFWVHNYIWLLWTMSSNELAPTIKRCYKQDFIKSLVARYCTFFCFVFVWG